MAQEAADESAGDAGAAAIEATTAPSDEPTAKPAPAEPSLAPQAVAASATAEAQATVIEAGAQQAEVIEAGAYESDDAFNVSLRWSGYVDFGFFVPQGDGAGHQQDVGHLIFPQHDDVAWVFHGDPLSTPVSSRGEPADLGDEGNTSRAIALDSVDSHGKPGFLINEVNLDLTAGLHRRVWLLASIDLLPRGRNISDREGVQLGDMFEVDLAFANWTAYDTGGAVVDVQVGKFDSVMGIEYRIQESPDRFGITPSLIFRYLGGHPLGVKARARFFDESVNVALAITNGSHFIEGFPFADEQDSNAMKTVAGRVGVRYDEDFTIEVGASGLAGAQDGQPEIDPLQWQIGADLDLIVSDFELRAEYTRGEAPGMTETTACDLAPCLRFQGAYAELSYRLTNWLGLLTRGDFRDADHRSGEDFLYIVDIARVTFGTRFELDRAVIVKAEYLKNLELEGRPAIDNDMFTTSFVAVF